MTIFFLRHGKLDLPYKDHSEIPFGIMSDLASGKLNPPIDRDFSSGLLEALKPTLNDVKRIICSPAQRCQDTARLIASGLEDGIVPEIEPNLAEAKFDLTALFSNSGDEKLDIASLNEVVLQGILDGKCESVDSIMDRLEVFFGALTKAEQGDAVCVTHDFLMRFIELYIKNKGSIRNVGMDMLRQTKRNTYLRGFRTNSDLSEFAPIA